MDDIYNRFKNFVLPGSLIASDDKILLSLSAGKDSMFMFHLVMRLQQEIDFKIGIFHLNHLTRGDESDKDEIFVKDIASSFGIPCYLEQFNFKTNKSGGLSFEEQAREVRYSLLKKISESDGYSKIATAHNMNDNAETVLMRILSGTGISGIKGITPFSKNIIRPVLFADKNEIYQYLANNNIGWREDLSNSENLYLRNYVRNIIIPAVISRFPDAEMNLFNLSGHAAENQSLIYSLADKLYPEAVIKNQTGIIIDVDRFHEDIPLIKLFISRVLYDDFGIKMKISIHNEIIRRYMINSANKLLYQKDDLIIRKGLHSGKKVIYITDQNEIHDLAVHWEYNLLPDENSTIFIKEINRELKVLDVNYDFYMENKDRKDIIFIQPDNDLKKIVLRNRRPGDRISIEAGTKKIKDIMIEKKLDSKIKNCIPIIAADDQVAAFLPGLINSLNNRVGCNFNIRNDTKRILAFLFKDY